MTERKRLPRLTEAEVRALPVTVTVPTAGRAFGIGRTMAYRLAKDGAFPCQVLPFGENKLVVTKAALLIALGMGGDGPAAASAA